MDTQIAERFLEIEWYSEPGAPLLDTPIAQAESDTGSYTIDVAASYSEPQDPLLCTSISQAENDTHTTVDVITTYEAIPDSEEEAGKEEQQSRLSGRDGHPQRIIWSPFFLRRSTAVVFLSAFIAISVSFVALHRFSNRNGNTEGIKTDNRKYFYLWRYGPPAAFMFIGTFWHQLEYRACQLMPWLLMARNPTPASESILLDYVSEWNVISLYKSMRRGHYLVTLAILGTLLINGLAIVLTGLFDLSPIAVEYPIKLERISVFDSSMRNPLDISGKPFLRSIATRVPGLDPPLGIWGNTVFAPFQDTGTKNTINSTIDITANTDMLSINVECVKANASKIFRGYEIEALGCQQRFNLRIEEDEMIYRGSMFLDIGSCNGEPGAKRVWGSILKDEPSGERENENYEMIGAMCTLQYNPTHGPVRILERPGAEISVEIDVDNSHSIDLPDFNSSLIVEYITSVYKHGEFRLKDVILASPLEDDIAWNRSIIPEQLARTIQSLAVNIVHENMLAPNNDRLDGIKRTSENRLFVRDLSFYLAIGILLILILVILLLTCFLFPITVCSRDPSSIAGLAVIAAQSPEFMETLAGMNLMSASEMQDSLSGQYYVTTLSPEGTFAIKVDERQQLLPKASWNKKALAWWRPISTNTAFYIPSIVAPLAIVVALEVLLHSQRLSGGIAPVNGKMPWITYTWSYIPASLFFGLRCLFQMIDFNARIFHPFHHLPKGNTRADISVLENQHRKIPVYGIFDSLRKRQWALVASTLTLLLAAFLPIAVSGLYDINHFHVSTVHHFIQNKKWALNTPNAEMIFDLKFNRSTIHELFGGIILYMNMTYPRWTHKDLVFLPFTLSNTEGNINFLDLDYVELRLPAWRFNLNCHEVPPTAYTVSNSSSDSPNVNVVMNDEVCGWNSISRDFINPNDYFSQYSVPTGLSGDIPYDCAVFGYMFGKFLETSVENIQVLKCGPKIEEVDVDVRLQLPSYNFDQGYPPSVVAGSERIIYDRLFNATKRLIYPYRMDFMLPSRSWRLDFSKPFDVHDPYKPLDPLDHVTQAAIFGKYGIPAEELLSNATKLADALSQVLSITMAQILNEWGSIPIDSSDTNSTSFPGTFKYNTPYLVQDRLSTRILDGLLIGVCFCGVITVSCLKTRKILPKNPCSIGALASLLAASRMLQDRDIIPRGAEWWADKELQSRGVLVNRRFRLGWARNVSIDENESENNEDGGSTAEAKIFCIDVDP
ncbi:hypothetical protein FQN57_001434 [Myotisia sp. PD_48]|nr:hypothetical protein FQN57_001434 [Myotisia sp. PD_48]